MCIVRQLTTYHKKNTKSFLAARVLEVTFLTGVFGEPKIPDDSMMKSSGLKLETNSFWQRTVDTIQGISRENSRGKINEREAVKG